MNSGNPRLCENVRGETEETTSVSVDWTPLAEVEGHYVAKVLTHTQGNKQAAARILEVDRKTLDRMIKRHDISTVDIARLRLVR